MNPRVKAVYPLPDYKLKVIFNSNEEGIFDCSSLLNIGAFRELKKMSYFNQVKARHGTVVWPHEQDICPDTVYIESKKIMQ